MPRVPKKNISGVLFDIKPPRGARRRVTSPPRGPARGALRFIERAPAPRHVPKAARRRRTRIFHALLTACGVLLLGAGIYTGLLYREKGMVYARAGAATQSLREAVRFFTEFNPSAARRSLESADRELKDLRAWGDQYGIWSIADMAGKFWPTVEQIPRAFRLIETLTRSAIEVANGAAALKANGLAQFTSGEGEQLIAELEKIRAHIRTIRETAEELSSFPDMLESFAALRVPDNYLKWHTELLRTEEFLDGVLVFLRAPGERHALLFFQNRSEMRPSGGFIGSYADLTIARGAMQELDVRDIYDPDGQLDLKVIPPRPLWAVTTSWGARDANWFFDFPTSAGKVIDFLEASKMYAERRITFDGVIALNTDVIESVLELTGPIELPAYKLAIDANNFLTEVQKEVEAGESKRVGEPKRILRDLAPLLLTRLTALPEAPKHELIARIAEHFERGDIVFTFRDPVLQNFFLAQGYAGAIADLPHPFYGDYLAVVNANIAGGKTDIYIKQDVNARSAIDLTGAVVTDVTVKRTHTGANARENWYRAANQNYLRLLVPPDAKLVSLTGVTPKTVRAPINYEKNNYRADPDVVRLEVDEQENGKKVIGAWFSVKAGMTGTLRARYGNPALVPLRDGGVFTVILEQQSGVRQRIRYEVEAPPGFAWREADDTVYVYESEDPPKRVIVTLTLKKI